MHTSSNIYCAKDGTHFSEAKMNKKQKDKKKLKETKEEKSKELKGGIDGKKSKKR